MYLLRILEIQELAEGQAAVFKVGDVDDIGVEVNVCFECECRQGLEEIVGAGFVIRVENGRDRLIRDESDIPVAAQIGDAHIVYTGLSMRGKGELPDLQS